MYATRVLEQNCNTEKRRTDSLSAPAPPPSSSLPLSQAPPLPESAPVLYKILATAYEKQRQEFLNGLLRNAYLARHVMEMMRKLKIYERKSSP